MYIVQDIAVRKLILWTAKILSIY